MPKRTRTPVASHPADALNEVLLRAQELDVDADVLTTLKALRDVQDAAQDAMCSLTAAVRARDIRSSRNQITYEAIADACDLSISSVHRWAIENRTDMRRMLSSGPTHPSLRAGGFGS